MAEHAADQSERGYTVARVVFTIISILGWLVLLVAPLWVVFFGAASALIGPASAAGGIGAAVVQIIFGLCMIAGAQLGLAQLAVANNTSAILALLRNQAKPQQLVNHAGNARKEPWLRAEK